MQHTISPSLRFSLLLVGAVGLSSLACGGAAAPEPAKAPTATTGAEVADPAANAGTATAEPTSAPVAEKASAPADAPPGRLVCRTVNAVDGTSELYLDWSGKEAKGTLRRITQSGMVHNDRVNAEREGGIILVDDPHEPADLVTHTAILQQTGGTLQMRLGHGMSGAWSKCE